jgi:hypothetical protein
MAMALAMAGNGFGCLLIIMSHDALAESRYNDELVVWGQYHVRSCTCHFGK